MKKSVLFLLSSIVCLIIFCASSCEKDKPILGPEEQLPPITQEGKGTFGCKVNGKVWLPKVTKGCGIFGCTYEPIECYLDRKKMKISVGANIYTDSQYEGIGMYFWPVNSVMEFSLTNNDTLTPSGGYNNIITGKSYITDSINTGKATIIKFDTITRIISGTFYMSPKNAGGEVIQITEGRFDLKYTF